ncbi:hypothetical protein [Lysobacter sp. FW306-1B-D06B]|uniref:hypothetical protein n=1 Tax=Lysobacter sp. FW306-1B-D06B TaxID=3140250 RepID=UPI0031403617
MAMECTIRAGAVASALMLACAASAATRTGSFQVTARIDASCLMRAPSSFDTMPAAVRSNERVQVICSPAVPHAVSMTPRISSGRADHTPAARRLIVFVTY